MQPAIRVIGTGSIGGKATGFWRARQILLSQETLTSHPAFEQILYFPRTILVATDLFDEFVSLNKLRPLLEACKSGDPQAYSRFEEACLRADFPEEIDDKFGEIWDTMPYPLAVRSSSVLEDRSGTSFAGKYSTLFISNHGPHKERWRQLSEAIKKVYVSVTNPSAIEYRRKHNLLDEDEKMAVMIQRAVGQEYKGWFFPLLAGVGFSQSGYCWHQEVKKEDGLVRLVFGLGTRAVGRGYARLFSPGKPTSRPEGYDAAAIEKYSQGTMDVLNLAANSLDSIGIGEVIENGFDCYPGAEKFFSLREGRTIYVPVSKVWNTSATPVLTFDSILSQPWAGVNFPKLVGSVMKVLEKGFTIPIDMEFAGELEGEEFRLNILQARALTQREEQNPPEIPKVLEEDVVFLASRDVPTGMVKRIEYIIWVDPDGYFTCPHKEKYTAARVIGGLNRALKGKRFALIGPGRWGSVKVELGIPAVYAEICNTAMLAEVAIGRYAPEVSFGTHFFQDLIEDGILYIPIYPDEPKAVFNGAFLKGQNSFCDILTDPHDRRFADIIRVIHVPSVSGGKYAHVVSNGVTEKAVMYLK